jgi:hypothetical protein
MKKISFENEVYHFVAVEVTWDEQKKEAEKVLLHLSSDKAEQKVLSLTKK